MDRNYCIFVIKYDKNVKVRNPNKNRGHKIDI